MPDPGKTALVLVDHGSRSEAANRALEEAAAEVARQAGSRYVAVLTAHLEIVPPTVADAFDAAVRAGAEFVVVALYFLSPGRHSESDVPRLAAEAASRHCGLRYTVTSCLGPHPSLAALVLERAERACSGN